MWPEWTKTGTEARREWLTADAETGERRRIAYDGTETATEEGVIGWIERARSEGTRVRPALDLGGALGRCVRSLVGGNTHGASPTVEIRIERQRGVGKGVTEAGAVEHTLALDAAERDDRDRLEGDVKDDAPGTESGVEIGWREARDPHAPAEAGTLERARVIARRSPVPATVNGTRMRRDAVPAGATHVQAVPYEGGTVWAWRATGNEPQRSGSRVREGVRERPAELPVLVQDRRRARRPSGAEEPRKVIARCVSVRAGRVDEAGEHSAAVEALARVALARVARSMMEAEEAMLLDVRSLRIAADLRPAVQTFAATLAHTGARISEVLATRACDVELDAAELRVRTLKRRREHWRSVPVPVAVVHDLDLVHRLRRA